MLRGGGRGCGALCIHLEPVQFYSCRCSAVVASSSSSSSSRSSSSNSRSGGGSQNPKTLKLFKSLIHFRDLS